MSPKTSSQLFLKKVKSFNIAKRYEKSNKIQVIIFVEILFFNTIINNKST
jgi:hypothetical protein